VVPDDVAEIVAVSSQPMIVTSWSVWYVSSVGLMYCTV